LRVTYEKYTDRYFLTLHGWVLDDGTPQPPDCIQIWERKVEQGSGFGRQSENWSLGWTKKGTTDEAVAKLEHEFPRSTRSKTLSPEALKTISKMMRS
jgi:hypothetical protein